MYNSPVSFRVARFLAFSSLLFLLGFAAASESGGKAKLSYKLPSIKVKGLNHFNEDDIITESGLKLGQFAGEDEFKHAAQKLGETGLFTNLTYTYQYSTTGCNLELQVAENDKLVPIVFDNFVWFTDDEIVAAIRKNVPFFNGTAPASGETADKIAAALQRMLTSKNIAGQVDCFKAQEKDAAQTRRDRPGVTAGVGQRLGDRRPGAVLGQRIVQPYRRG